MSDSDFIDTKADICGGASSSSGSSLSPRTPPNCARCKNHGLKITLKGHKRYCKYRCCNCEKCRLTSDRQKIMALQTSWRRAQAQDEARALLMGEVPPTAPVTSFLHHHHHLHHHHSSSSSHSHTTKIITAAADEYSSSKDHHPEPASAAAAGPAIQQTSLEGSCDSSSSPSSTSGVASSPLARKLTPIHPNGAHMPFGQSAEVFLEYCQKLLEKFRYPWEMMPLMYVILKDAKADIEEASRRIDEAKQFVRLYLHWKAMAFPPTNLIQISPMYLEANGLYPSQICSTATTRPPTPEPPPRPRSRSLPIVKPKPENLTVETSST